MEVLGSENVIGLHKSESDILSPIHLEQNKNYMYVSVVLFGVGIAKLGRCKDDNGRSIDHAVRKGSSWKHATYFFRKVLRNKFISHCIASEADPQGQSGRGPRYI